MSVAIVNGDCLKVMQGMADASVDLIFSSPPYNIGKEYERRRALELYEAWITPILAECVRVLRPGGSICWQVGTYVQGKARSREVLPLDFFFWPIFDFLGLCYRHRIVWHFGHGLHNKHSFSGRHEVVMWLTKGECCDADAIRERLGGVWDIPNVKHNHPEKTAHPCQFPEALVRPFITELTKPGALVLDPFAGAGTVGAACAKLGRRATLIELDAGYCEIIAMRLGGAVQPELIGRAA